MCGLITIEMAMSYFKGGIGGFRPSVWNAVGFNDGKEFKCFFRFNVFKFFNCSWWKGCFWSLTGVRAWCSQVFGFI
jgi:hypothetical protein